MAWHLTFHAITLIQKAFLMRNSQQRRSVLRWNLVTLQWRHNEGDGVSNHQPHDCLLNRLFRGRSKKISKLKWPVTRKMFPFHDVIMSSQWCRLALPDYSSSIDVINSDEIPFSNVASKRPFVIRRQIWPFMNTMYEYGKKPATSRNNSMALISVSGKQKWQWIMVA